MKKLLLALVLSFATPSLAQDAKQDKKTDIAAVTTFTTLTLHVDKKVQQESWTISIDAQNNINILLTQFKKTDETSRRNTAVITGKLTDEESIALKKAFENAHFESLKSVLTKVEDSTVTIQATVGQHPIEGMQCFSFRSPLKNYGPDAEKVTILVRIIVGALARLDVETR